MMAPHSPHMGDLSQAAALQVDHHVLRAFLPVSADNPEQRPCDWPQSRAFKMQAGMSPLRLFLLVLPLVLLPLTANAQVPTISLTAAAASHGNVVYLASLKLAIPPTASDLTEASSIIDTNAAVTSVSFSNCTKNIAQARLWSLVTVDSGLVADTGDVPVGNIAILCKKKNKTNIAGLSHEKSALPSQVISNLNQRPYRFAYSLSDSGGLLFFGKTIWVQYTSFAPEREEAISFVRIPMKLASSGGYQLKLTGIGFRSFLIGQGEQVQISTTKRFTTLPSKMYSFLLNQFQQQVAEKSISKAATSYGKLKECYQTNQADVSSFPNVTMVFSSKFRWSVPANKYLVEKPNAGSVFCFAYLEAGAGTTGIIGTLQQQGRVIEYDLKNKTLGVSLPLVGPLLSP